MKESIQKILRSRYYLSKENKWEDIAKRVSDGFSDIYDYIKNHVYIPSSPTLMNMNTKGERKGTLSSCFPMWIEDSISGIFDALKECALVTKAGGGIGLNFSTLRSSKELINSIKRNSSGPLSFISNFNTMLDSINQAGVRRGAGMAQLSVDHPDILDFIESKKDFRTNVYSRFNFTVRIPDSFYKALEERPDEPHWVTYKNNEEEELKDKDGNIISTKQLWDKIVHCALVFAEPGIFNETIAFNQCTVTNLSKEVLSNPCSEYVSIPYSSCNLGSINLSKLVKYNKFDWDEFKKVIEISTRFLDRVIDKNEYPLKKIEDITKKIRPMGLGFMGLAHMFYKLQIPYNSKEAIELARDITRIMTLESMTASVALAKKHGAYKGFDCDLYLKANDRLLKQDYAKGLTQQILDYGIRNSSNTSIAPTGTISTIAETSSGIEPIFSLSYIRKVEVADNKYDLMYINDPVFDEFLTKNYSKTKKKILEHVVDNKGSCQGCTLMSEEDRKIFITAQDLTPMEHLDMLEVVAVNTSLSVSKTVNVPKDATEEQIAEVYLEAHKRGIIGVTVYRDESRQGVLVSSSKTDGKLTKTKAPKRPKEVDAEVYHFIIKKQRFYVVVGLYDNEPYEIFCDLNYNNDGEVYIPKHIDSGEIVKESRGKYYLVKEDERYNLVNGNHNDEIDALTRILSTALRHGTPIQFIVDQLSKTKGDITSFSKALSRTLKKYIPEGTKSVGVTCPNCKGSNLRYEDGCKKCNDCGFSICG